MMNARGHLFCFSAPLRRIRQWSLPLALILTALGAPVGSVAQELPTASPEDVGMSSERLDRLTDALQQYVEDDRLPGAVVMVLRDGHVVYHEAVGNQDIEAGAPMRGDAIFRIA
ncbi:MAG: serine hydrolase, partial [Longimicrobiales bacterium]